MNHWTFGKKVGAGFTITVVLTLIMAGMSISALQTVMEAKDEVIRVNAQNLVDTQLINGIVEQKVSEGRGYLLSKDPRFLESIRSLHEQAGRTLEQLRSRLRDEEQRVLSDKIRAAEGEHHSVLERAIVLRKSDASIDSIQKFFDEQVVPKREALERHMNDFVARQEAHLASARQLASDNANNSIRTVVVISFMAVAFATMVAFLLTRSLSRQLGSAVQHVHSSSAELQAAANQQATGAKEQATAMNEITTTITELLATSRQITESAQRVAGIAEDTASAGRAGDQTMRNTQDVLGSIKRQVDLIVAQMLDLGRKSQQIGGILEIINELAEQTNILAINATIEAAGAGESGKRFAVVAEEVRKLADRVGGSTKEIRDLISEIRSAVNTTVMATESGSKAVDAGTRQFGEVATAFSRIAELVGTTHQAAREIGLSTKQQSTAVEQVQVAISNVAQATRESEASSSQTLQTASQLTHLSEALNRLIQPRAVG